MAMTIPDKKYAAVWPASSALLLEIGLAVLTAITINANSTGFNASTRRNGIRFASKSGIAVIVKALKGEAGWKAGR